jgi:hypothetical protein
MALASKTSTHRGVQVGGLGRQGRIDRLVVLAPVRFRGVFRSPYSAFNLTRTTKPIEQPAGPVTEALEIAR